MHDRPLRLFALDTVIFHVPGSLPEYGLLIFKARGYSATWRDRTTKFGQRIGQATAASFRCAVCDEMADRREGNAGWNHRRHGPPLSHEKYDRDAIVVDYFLRMASRLASPF